MKRHPWLILNTLEWHLDQHSSTCHSILGWHTIHTQGSYSFELFKFHDFQWLFPWHFQVLQDLTFSCQFQKFKTFTCFRVLFDLKQFNRHKLWSSPKCVLLTLLNYSSLSYFVLALSSAVNNLSNTTWIFHDFQGPTIPWLSRPGNEILKFHDFPGFPWPVRTLQIIVCQSISQSVSQSVCLRRKVERTYDGLIA